MNKNHYKNITIVENLEDASFITHSGKFHIDDVMSTIFLSKLFDEIKLYRASSIKNEDISDDVLIYDIGLGKFDHHQHNKNGKRKNGIYYSSLGLLWKNYGSLYLKKFKDIDRDKVFKMVDEELIQYIDAGDNRQSDFFIGKKVIMPDLIKLCNVNWDDNISETEAFLNALKVGDEFWDIFFKTIFSRVKAMDIVKEKLKNCHENYLILDYDMPYMDAINDSANIQIKYVIYPSKREGFDIRCIGTKFKDVITKSVSLDEAKKIMKNDTILYIDFDGKLCCTTTLQGAIKLIEFNELS